MIGLSPDHGKCHCKIGEEKLYFCLVVAARPRMRWRLLPPWKKKSQPRRAKGSETSTTREETNCSWLDGGRFFVKVFPSTMLFRQNDAPRSHSISCLLFIYLHSYRFFRYFASLAYEPLGLSEFSWRVREIFQWRVQNLRGGCSRETLRGSIRTAVHVCTGIYREAKNTAMPKATIYADQHMYRYMYMLIYIM